MSSNHLSLNPHKMQFIWLGTRQQLAKLDMIALTSPFSHFTSLRVELAIFIKARNSFKDLYSPSSRKLLRGAPDSSTVKKNSFQLITECVLPVLNVKLRNRPILSRNGPYSIS